MHRLLTTTAAAALMLAANVASAAPIVLGSSTSGDFDFVTTGQAIPLAMTTLGGTVSGPAQSGGDLGSYTFGIFNTGTTPNLGPAVAGTLPFSPPNTDSLSVTLAGGSASFTVTFEKIDGTTPIPTIVAMFDLIGATGDLTPTPGMGPFTGTISRASAGAVG